MRPGSALRSQRHEAQEKSSSGPGASARHRLVGLARRAGAGCALAALVASAIAGCGFGERRDILVLVRADDPVSRAIGEHYAATRKIPAERILELSLTGGASERGDVARDEIDADGFEREIAAPIEAYLAAHDPDGDIVMLVTTRGLPLRLGHCDETGEHYLRACEAAAVDAALAALGRLPPGGGPRAARSNPFFRDPRSFERFRREQPEATLRFLVARLTGPATPADPQSGLPRAVEALIERGAAAVADRDEQDEGMDGERSGPPSPLWQIVAQASRDTRSAATAALLDPIAGQLPKYGHRACDGCSPLEAGGAPIGIVLQALDVPALPDARPLPARLAAPGVVIGLMAGPRPAPSEGEGEGEGEDPARDETAFEAFVAAWIERGAGAISTHVADPSLAGVTRPAAQMAAWAAGRSAVEAHFQSVPQLGWMNVFVGDPLLAMSESHIEPGDDRDFDGVADAADNCLDDPNPAQRDSNGDGLGNRCDPDVDDDGRVLTSWGRIYPVDTRGDLEAIALTARNGPHDPDHDLDGDGRVDERDLVRAQLWLFRAPGPSGRSAD